MRQGLVSRLCLVCPAAYCTTLHFVVLYWAMAVPLNYNPASASSVPPPPPPPPLTCCSVGVCTLSLAVALGSGVLLLFSVVGSEVHRAFPHSAYTQWLNRALFTGCARGRGGEGRGCGLALTPLPCPQVCGTMSFWSQMSVFCSCCPLGTSSWNQRGSLGHVR